MLGVGDLQNVSYSYRLPVWNNPIFIENKQ